MAYIKEPYVRASENIRQFPVLLNLDGTSNIGGVIVAPTGPRLAYVSGPKDFLEKYTLDGNIPRNAHYTFINAYYLSFSAGLVLVRSMNTTAVQGVCFTPKKEGKTEILLDIKNSKLWGLTLDGKIYFHNGKDKSFEGWLTAITDQKLNVNSDPGVTTPLYSLADKDKAVQCNDFQDLANELAKSLTNGKTLEGSYKTSKITLQGSYAPKFEREVSLVTRVVQSKDKVVSLESHQLLFKDNVALTESQELTVDFTKGTDPAKTIGGSWAFVYGSMAYYHGAVDHELYSDYSMVPCDSADDLLTSINGISGLAATLKKGSTDTKVTIEISYSKGNELSIYANEGCEATLGTVTSNKSYQDALFTVFPDQPSDNNQFKAVFYPNEGDLFDITLDRGGKRETFTVSLNASALDRSGNNAYIENLNVLRTGFTFLVNSENVLDISGEKYNMGKGADNKYWAPKLTSVCSFGDSGLDLSASKSQPCMTSSLSVLADQELYDIEYLAPMGITDSRFIKMYTMIGRAHDWLTPTDVPYDKTNASSIGGYFLNVDLSSNVVCMGPFDKNTGLTGWMNYIACSTLYYTKIMRNKAVRCEFAPTFDLTNGVLDFTDPVYLLGKEDRETLLNLKAPVNFVVYNQRTNTYYLNNNLTHQEKSDIASEEQNRRLINKVKKDCKRLVGRFKGRINTNATRSDVVSLLNYYFSTAIMNQEYRPNDFQVVCDESNNSEEDINANRLGITVRLRLQGAIKYIDVLVDVFPLGVDFNS